MLGVCLRVDFLQCRAGGCGLLVFRSRRRPTSKIDTLVVPCCASGRRQKKNKFVTRARRVVDFFFPSDKWRRNE